MNNPWRDIPADILRKGFSGIYRKENRGCQRIPSIACTQRGRLWAVWQAGGNREPHIDSYGVIACSEDGGQTWKDPVFIIDHPDAKRVRVGNLVPWLDEQGRLWVSWAQIPGDWHLKENVFITTWAACMEYPDAPACSFGKPMFMFSGTGNNKPIRLKTGEWLFAAEDVLYPHESYIYSVDRLGNTPLLRGTAHSRTPWKFSQSAQLIERRDGSLWQLTRIESGHFGGMEEAVSRDGALHD